MTTTAIKKTVKKQASPKNVLAKYDLKSINEDGTFMNVPINQIDTCPLNYRKFYDDGKLQELADDIAQHGIIHPLTLRKTPNGRFELVVGERRFRAAKSLKRKSVPAMIKMLTDEQVIELMLAENLNRVDPHPLHEAEAIYWMHKTGKSIEEIALRLVKSKSYIYCRIKWASLILPFKEMFLANKINIQQANDISILSTESQQEFFEKYCSEWESDKFNFDKLKFYVSLFKYDLNKAPFNPKDKTLLPEAGACTNCPFNSATVKSLFPELAKDSICSHKVCFHSKCLKHLERELHKLLKDHKPEVLLVAGNFSQEIQTLIDSQPEINALPRMDYDDVYKIDPPLLPHKEDYMDIETAEFYQEDYDCALIEYEADKAEYNLEINSENVKKGITIFPNHVLVVYFKPEKEKTNGTVTAKEVQQAIKEGTVTAELLTQEKARIVAREKRAKEIDADNVQKKILKDFSELAMSDHNSPALNAMDCLAARLVVFQSLDWNIKAAVCKKIFPEANLGKHDELLKSLASMSDSDYSYLIRMVFCRKGGSINPNSIDGLCLYRLAAESGFDVKSIEDEIRKKADERQEKVDSKIADLERRIEKMKAKTK